MLTLSIDQEKCTGCRLCTLLCGLGHAGDQPVARVLRGDPPRGRIHVREMEPGAFHLSVCRHCEDAVCEKGCVAAAISRDPDRGVVRIDAEKCVGCWTCVLECPFGAIELVPAAESKPRRASKCDGCVDVGTPLCVRFCPTGAVSEGVDAAALLTRSRRERSSIGRAFYCSDSEEASG